MDIKDRNTTSEGIEQQFGVNHVGHFLLTRLLEGMIKAKNGRIVYLLNLDYRLGVVDFSDINFTHRKYNPSTAYKQSQLANAMFIQHYSKLNSPDVLTINGAYPGVCNTNIKRHMSVERSFFGSYVSGPFLNLFGRQSIEGAQTPLKLLIDPSLEGVTGKLFSNLEEINVNDKATQNDLNTRLYLMDEYWTDLITHEDLVKSNVRVQSKTNE
nr:retinol dehydrogenase 13-like [Lepeophtheirus salmonis]